MSTYFWRLHVQNFCDTALHDQEVRIVNVELNGVEKVLNASVGSISSIDQVLILPANDNLTSDSQLIKLFIAVGR